jgi:ABC-type branched-subunit amino acid transport system ATPase component
VRGLCKSFDATKALDGVDLKASAGRSTRCSAERCREDDSGLDSGHAASPDAGTASVAGLDVAVDAAALRWRIGLTGRFTAVDPLLTGQENLQITGRLCQLGRREAARRADDMLERFSLAAAAGRLARSYSGGMLRRLDPAASSPVLILERTPG